MEDPGGCAARTRLLDELLAALAEACGLERCALVATGGYGRRELAPRSDVDLLLLRPEGEWDPAPGEALLRRLWDAGLEVGHAVRTPAGARAALTSDLHAATGLLEGRRVWGDPALFAALRAEVAAFVAGPDRARFAQAKLREALERHSTKGATVCLLAPDLKEGRGTLRDLQLAQLLAALAAPGAPAPDAPEPADVLLPALPRAHGLLASWLGLSPAAARELAAARALLLSCRTALHEAVGAGERLEPHLQDELARRFGFADRDGRLAMEIFMDQVYRAAKRVDRALRRVRLLLEPTAPEPFRRTLLAPGVIATGDEVVLDPPQPEPEHVAAVVAQLFLQAQSTRRRIGLQTLEAVRGLIAGRGDAMRQDPLALETFREVLRGAKGVAATLRAMHECGYLGVLLPEFAALDCLAQADAYHAYTVDEHTLAVLAALEGEPALPDGGSSLGPGVPLPPAAPAREELLREELLHTTPERDLLRLGVLLHDAGKVGGAVGHVERGVGLVRGVAWRLGLSSREERHVAFLVAHHLTLSRLAEKRDVGSPETVLELLEVVDGELVLLEHLYLLTAADIAGVSPRAMSRWKDALITRLYEQGREAIERGERALPRRPDSLEGWEALLAPRARDVAGLHEHLRLCTSGYLAEVEPEDVLLHQELAAALGQAGEPGAGPATFLLRWSLDVGCERVWIAARDRPGLLAELFGAFTGEGLDLLGVQTFARRDGVVFDQFVVTPSRALESEPPAARYPRLEQRVAEVLAGRDPEELIHARIRRSPAPPAPAHRPPPVRVRVSNEVSDRTTMIDVSAPDRVGLLFDLARVIARHGGDIRLCKVTVKGDRMVGVFYLTGPSGEQLSAEERAAIIPALAAAAGPRA